MDAPQNQSNPLVDSTPDNVISVEEVFAETAYERYNKSTGGLNYRGEPCPTWYQLPGPQKQAWVAAIAPLVPPGSYRVLRALNAKFE